MSSLLYKKKISKSLDTMDAGTLKQAWLILKEIGSKKSIPAISDKKKLESQLAKGIQQLDNGEGTDFGSFIGGLKRKYGEG
jgi:hypothetical protein